MRRWNMLAAMIIVLMSLCACSNTTYVENTTAAVASFSADIVGDVLCDSKVTVRVSEEAGGIITCQWYVEGDPLRGAADDTLHIPVTAGKKKLRVVAQTQNGIAESDEINIQGSQNTKWSMAGLYYDIKTIGGCIIVGNHIAADFFRQRFWSESTDK